MSHLSELNWQAIASTDFRDPVIKDGKQAEFLIHESFPWQLVEKIGVCSDSIATQVAETVKTIDHSPSIVVKMAWYY